MTAILWRDLCMVILGRHTNPVARKQKEAFPWTRRPLS